MDVWDLIIIGGGPAGLTAGMYAARARLKTLLLEGGVIGGQATTTDWIENYPGFPEGVSGFELMLAFLKQAERFGLEVRYEEVLGLQSANGMNTVSTSEASYQAKAIVIASGAKHRHLGAPGEEEFHGRGVSYCATCDGAFFQDKTVAVVGGGDAAVEEAVFLTRYADKVYLVHRRDKLRATSILQERAFNNPKITLCWNSTVEEIKGEGRVETLVLNDVTTLEKRVLKVDGVFVYVGIDPNTAFLSDEFHRNKEGYVWVDQTLQTSIPGVFAAGDVRDKDLRQVATAVGDGAMVVFSVERYLTAFEYLPA